MNIWPTNVNNNSTLGRLLFLVTNRLLLNSGRLQVYMKNPHNFDKNLFFVMNSTWNFFKYSSGPTCSMWPSKMTFFQCSTLILFISWLTDHEFHTANLRIIEHKGMAQMASHINYDIIMFWIYYASMKDS